MMKSTLALTALHAAGVLADGAGFIGYGKTMYNPTCAFACRNVIKSCKLSCTPDGDGGANHGTAHSPVSTPPDCFVRDTAFLRTMAVCIGTYCPLSNKPSADLIDDYWASHLGTGSLGNYQWVPAVSYHDALAAGRADEERLRLTNATTTPAEEDASHHHHRSTPLKPRHLTTPNITSPLPLIKPGAPLNTTSFISPAAWTLQYTGMTDFETNENGHSTYTLTLLLTTILLPIPLSLLRFVPRLTTSRTWTTLQSALLTPALYGKHHRSPTTAGGVAVGLNPTRGQALYIALISLLNLLFLLAPYSYTHPQSTFPSRAAQELSVVGARAGVMAMGNVVGLVLFAGRNNVLLWVTDWSYGTFLLVHRWLGYWAVVQTVVHSGMLLGYYVKYGDYEAELVREYWIWGIVGTVAVVGIYLSSVHVVRQKVYEVFLVAHVVLVVVFIVGYYYHIWYCYQYNWGYEIWAFITIGIWVMDRMVRLGRIAVRGYRTAVVSLVAGTDGEYLRIDIEGTKLSGGVAYLNFPTLGWRFWESHPFSVAFDSSHIIPSEASTPGEKTTTASTITPLPISTDGSSTTKPTTTFFARVRTGVTANLASRAATASLRLGVLIDGPYNRHSGDASTQLKSCSQVIYIAGGVGITALLPHLRKLHHNTALPAHLYWATRKAGLATAVGAALAALSDTVEVEKMVGQRLDLDGILDKALVVRAGSETDDGPVGIVVCGPAGIADHVRHKVVQLARNGPPTRPYVLVDEAFGW